jgi:hypothetical protein
MMLFLFMEKEQKINTLGLKPMYVRATQIFQFFLPKMNSFCIYTGVAS